MFTVEEKSRCGHFGLAELTVTSIEIKLTFHVYRKSKANRGGRSLYVKSNFFRNVHSLFLCHWADFNRIARSMKLSYGQSFFQTAKHRFLVRQISLASPHGQSPTIQLQTIELLSTLTKAPSISYIIISNRVIGFKQPLIRYGWL